MPLASLQMSFSAIETLFGPWFINFFQSTEHSAANIYLVPAAGCFPWWNLASLWENGKKPDGEFTIQGFVLRNQIILLGEVYLWNVEKCGNWRRIYKLCLSQCHHVRDWSFLLTSDKKFLSIRSSILPLEGVRVFLFSPPPSSYGAIIVLCFMFYFSYCLPTTYS